MKRGVVGGLMLLSGATALVYQVTWMRDLSLVFGASHEATALVLASFMAGLALGGFSIGHLSERIRRPLRLYGVLEIGIALTALCVPLLFRGIDMLHGDWVRAAGGETVAATSLRVALSFAAVCVPTFLMGGTLPLVVRALVGQQVDLGTRFAWLYGANTLGAASGALAAGFVLIPMLGVWHTQLTAIVVNLLVGAIALGLDRGTDEAPRAILAPAATPSPAGRGETIRTLRIAFWGTAVAGFCSLALEVLWTRAITLAVGNTTYSVTVMLAAFLIGIWLGAWLRALVPLRGFGLPIQMGVVMVVLGATAGATSMLIPRLPVVMLSINLTLFGELSRVHAGTILLVAFSVMLAPCVLMGVAFPIAGEVRARLRSETGGAVGDALSANTLGSILGSLGAGFVMIPWLGLTPSAALVSALYLVYGLIVVAAALIASGIPRPRVGLGVALALGAAIAAALLIPPNRFGVQAAFNNNALARYTNARGGVDLESALASARVIHLAHGRSATVAVVERGGGRALMVNGKAVASDNLIDIPHELLLGHAPVLMHPSPKRVLVVGLGAGVTLGAVLAHPQVEQVTVVEIEENVVDAARLFGHVNDDALDDPRVEVVIGDGRNFLKTAADRFDVITADPIHPWAAGAGYLYTREYFALAAARLAAGGVLCQWIPGYELSEENFRSVVSTIASVFPESLLWQTAQDGIVVASLQPLTISMPELSRRLAAPRVASQLRQVGLEGPLDFVSELALNRDALPRWAAAAPVNTDDNLYLEYASPFAIGSSAVADIDRGIDLLRTGPTRHLRRAPAAGLAEALEARQWAKSKTLAALLEATDPEGDPLEAIEQLRVVLDTTPDYGPARMRLADLLSRRANASLRSGRRKKARDDAEEALRLDPAQGLALHVRGSVALRQRRVRDAIADLERAIEIRPRQGASHRMLAEAYTLVGSHRQAERAADIAAELSSPVAPSARTSERHR